MCLNHTVLAPHYVKALHQPLFFNLYLVLSVRHKCVGHFTPPVYPTSKWGLKKHHLFYLRVGLSILPWQLIAAFVNSDKFQLPLVFYAFSVICWLLLSVFHSCSYSCFYNGVLKYCNEKCNCFKVNFFWNKMVVFMQL